MDTEKVLTQGRLETLSRGRVMELVNEKLEEALKHCLAAPGLDKPRELVLTVRLKPLLEEGEAAVNIGTSVNLKLPGHKGPSDRAVWRNGEFQVFSVPSTAERQMDVVDFASRAGARNGE